MTRNHAVVVLLALLSLAAVSRVSAAEQAAPKAAPKPKAPAVTRTLDAQVSGFTSQDADNIYARLAMEEKKDGRTWYVKGSHSRTQTKATRYYTVSTTKLDSRLERALSERDFSVLTAVVSTRDRSYYSSSPNDSGYEFASYGVGRRLDANMRGDLGLGLLRVRDDDDGFRPALVAALRGSRPLSDKLTLTADTMLLQPVGEADSTKLDSDIGFSYQMAPGFYLRLNWQATNLIRSAYSLSEWDSVWRLSIAFRQTTKH
ncbi:MAG: hypothetical protein KBC96_08620 [Armatimonadetes bacterium]|nr:hypothetical protein [Armatimonadota bacterium]